MFKLVLPLALFIQLYTLPGIISRYCYKSDINKRNYAFPGTVYAFVMHSERISGRKNLLPRGEYGLIFRAGLVSKIFSRRKKDRDGSG